MKTDKYSYLGMVFSCILLVIVFTILSLESAKGLQYLEEQEINHYVELAEKMISNNSHSLQDSSLKYELTEESITISSYNIFKQTVTVYFLDSVHTVVINNPTTKFVACSIFFGILAIISFIGIFVYGFKAHYEFKKCRIDYYLLRKENML